MFWLAAAAAAATVVVSVAGVMRGVERERESWGTTIRVAVADTVIEPGDDVAEHASFHAIPVAVTPSNAVRSFAPGARARQRIAAGEVVTEFDVTAGGGVGGLLPDGWMAVGIPVDTGAGGMYAVAARAAVLADGSIVSADAMILDATEGWVIVGVPADVAAVVAEAAIRRMAVVALSATP